MTNNQSYNFSTRHNRYAFKMTLLGCFYYFRLQECALVLLQSGPTIKTNYAFCLKNNIINANSSRAGAECSQFSFIWRLSITIAAIA